MCIGSITSSPRSAQSFLNWVSIPQDRVSYRVFKDGDIFPDYLAPCHVTLSRLDEKYQAELERLNLTISEILNSDQTPRDLDTRQYSRSDASAEIGI